MKVKRLKSLEDIKKVFETGKKIYCELGEADENDLQRFMKDFMQKVNSSFSYKDLKVELDPKRPTVMKIKWMNHIEFEMDVKRL